jgi:hypothetical protein
MGRAGLLLLDRRVVNIMIGRVASGESNIFDPPFFNSKFFASNESISHLKPNGFQSQSQSGARFNPFSSATSATSALSPANQCKDPPPTNATTSNPPCFRHLLFLQPPGHITLIEISRENEKESAVIAPQISRCQRVRHLLHTFHHNQPFSNTPYGSGEENGSGA